MGHRTVALGLSICHVSSPLQPPRDLPLPNTFAQGRLEMTPYRCDQYNGLYGCTVLSSLGKLSISLKQTSCKTMKT